MVRILKKRGELPEVIREIAATYAGGLETKLQHLEETPLPSDQVVIEILKKLRIVLFPGYFGREAVSGENVNFYIGELVYEIHETLSAEIYKAWRGCGDGSEGSGDRCHEEAEKACIAFLRRIPHLRRMLALDAKAAYDGDPAAESIDEIIFSYPCMSAIFVHRVAHELYLQRTPLIPRMMSEYAHRQTGIDIHPGAEIGESFFIDHGTGVVIGETTEIGRNVKIYQGVTLGALSFKEGAEAMRKKKRHPTIQDNVVIYAGATILGGDTVIGQDSVIGGNVWVVSSVPPRTKVVLELPRLKVRVNE